MSETTRIIVRRVAAIAASAAICTALLAGVRCVAAPTISALHDFSAMNADGVTNSDGAHCWAGLTLGSDGVTLYGVAADGGPNGTGTIFSIDPSGHFAVLHAFGAVDAATGANTDGAHPYAALYLGSDGLLYGTTDGGGAGGEGVVFSFSPKSHAFRRLHTFLPLKANGTNPDGADPRGGAMLASNGLVYGTSFKGGPTGVGTLYSIDAKSHLTVLHAFSREPAIGMGGFNGSYPSGRLTEYPFGQLWGTTSMGGYDNHGTVFTYDTATNAYSIVLRFAGVSNAYGNPQGADATQLVPTPGQSLVATTAYGGVGGSGGIVSFDSSGKFSVVYALDTMTSDSFNVDGAYPSRCAVDSLGDIYFTTCSGGADGHGQLDEYTASGSLVVLTQIEPTQNSESHAAPTLTPSGAIYGDTTDGGANGTGSIWVYN